MPAKTRRFLSLPPEMWARIDKLTDEDMTRGGHNFTILKLLKKALGENKPTHGAISFDPNKVKL